MSPTAAGDEYVTVMGGAQTGQQCIRANLGDEHIALEPLATIPTSNATHLRFRIVRAGDRLS